jgi:peptide-methionine (R)-S-oxide reductase
MKRRTFILSGVALPLSGQISLASSGSFEITRSKAEWKALLTDFEYKVMRREGTERPKSSPLNLEKRVGTYHCKGCDLPVYSSEAKYESGTGWPSFYESLPNAVRTKPDDTLFTRRTEVHCRRCGSHFGHIFNDGPKPTGKRHCLNGTSLKFVPA